MSGLRVQRGPLLSSRATKWSCQFCPEERRAAHRRSSFPLSFHPESFPACLWLGRCPEKVVLIRVTPCHTLQAPGSFRRHSQHSNSLACSRQRNLMEPWVEGKPGLMQLWPIWHRRRPVLMGCRDPLIPSPGIAPWRTPPTQSPRHSWGPSTETQGNRTLPCGSRSQSCSVIYQPSEKKKMLLRPGLGPWGVKVSSWKNKGGFTSPSTLPPLPSWENYSSVHISF